MCFLVHLWFYEVDNFLPLFSSMKEKGLTCRWIMYVDVFVCLFLCVCAEQRCRRSVWRVQAWVLPPIRGQPWGLSTLFLYGRHQAVCQLHLEQRSGGLLSSKWWREGWIFLVSRFDSVFVQSGCMSKSFQMLNGEKQCANRDCAQVGWHINLSSHLIQTIIMFLRCEEAWTGSSSPSQTVPTLKLSLKASPRGAPLKLSTAPSPVSPMTSTTGCCLRASEEIRWE